jgi:hypothetical protein
MKVLKTLLIIFLISTQGLFAQETVNFNNYKAPEFKLRALSLGLDGNNSIYSTKSYSLEAGSNYYQISNSPKKQSTVNQYLAFRNGDETNNFQNTENNRSTLWHTGSISTRKYINDNGLFIKNAFAQSMIIDNRINASKTIYDVSLNYGFSIGKGRIDNATAVYQTYFIIDDLRKAGIINESFSESELFELSQLIQKLSNTRVLDFRRQYVNQLETISTWLKNHRNVDDDIIKVGAIVADNIAFATNSSKYIGKRKSITVSGSLSKSNFYNLGIQNPYIGLHGTLEKGKSLSERWHTHQELTIGAFSNGSSDYELTPMANLRQTYIYSPQTRTNVSFTGGASVLYNNLNTFQARIDLGTNINYFLSYNTNFNVSFLANYGFVDNFAFSEINPVIYSINDVAGNFVNNFSEKYSHHLSFGFNHYLR